MKQQTQVSAMMLSAILLASSTAMAKEPAPQDRTYFILVMGLNDDPYEAEADCLTFDATQACSLNQICLSWQRSEGGLQTRKKSGFSTLGELDDDGLIVTMEGQGRVNSRGKRSSIAVVTRASALGVRLNFTVAGREVGRGRCRRMVEDFEAEMANR